MRNLNEFAAIHFTGEKEQQKLVTFLRKHQDPDWNK